MIELTVSEYLDLVASLKIGDFILFYFTVYFFIVYIQRAIGFPIDTIGQFRTSPKILASLILIQTFYFLHAKLQTHISLSTSYEAFVVTALLFIVSTYIFEKIFLSQKGLIKYIYRAYITPFAKEEVHHAKRKTNQIIEIDHENITTYAEAYSGQCKNIASLMLIDLYICIILSLKLLGINSILGIIFILFSIIFIKPHILGFKTNAASLKRVTQGKYAKNKA